MPLDRNKFLSAGIPGNAELQLGVPGGKLSAIIIDLLRDNDFATIDNLDQIGTCLLSIISIDSNYFKLPLCAIHFERGRKDSGDVFTERGRIGSRYWFISQNFNAVEVDAIIAAGSLSFQDQVMIA